MTFFKQQPPRLIKIFGTIFVLAILTYLHFMTPPSIDIDDTVGIDKLVHLLMFFITMIWFVNITSNLFGDARPFAAILLEKLLTSKRALFPVAIIRISFRFQTKLLFCLLF